MPASKILPDDVHERVKALCAEGDQLVAAKQYDEAITRYVQAWNELPEPRDSWDASWWISAAIGDAHFGAGRYGEARGLFLATIRMGKLGNPYVHLRLGQCCFEEGNMTRAADELCRAYMGGGREIFDGEDPKYLEFLATKIDPPVGQDRL